MDDRLRALAGDAIGFMPEDEGLALHEIALSADPSHPLLEIGSYCGKSAIYLGAAARAIGSVLYSIDHHGGSEEHQPGQSYHDPRLVDPATGAIDTLPEFARTIERAGLCETVIGIAGDSTELASIWEKPLGLAFIDGGHGLEAVTADYEGWAPKIVPGGFLVIHDVFEDPADGGRPPFEIYRRATNSGAFREELAVGSLRSLRRIAEGI